MGLRFRKRLKLLPGLWLNLSRSGVSTSVGVPGATVNLRKGRVRTTVGIPGSGLHYVETLPKPSKLPNVQTQPAVRKGFLLAFALALAGLAYLLHA